MFITVTFSKLLIVNLEGGLRYEGRYEKIEKVRSMVAEAAHYGFRQLHTMCYMDSYLVFSTTLFAFFRAGL